MRRRARSSVLDFARAIDIPGKPTSEDPDSEFFEPVETAMAKHHILILETLDRISQTPYGRLMLLCPPGSAKSTYASVVFPAFYLGKNARKRLILGSYGDDLARKMGRRTRSIIKQKRYQRIFDTELEPDVQSVQNFLLKNGSEYMAGGILSGITGNRADGVIIDDPVKGRSEANSEVIRESTWTSFQDNLKTRISPGGWMCIIQTRWHEDDLSGRILPETWNGESGPIECKDGNTWEVICLPAQCESDTGDPIGRKKGEYLWPEWFDLKHWLQFKANPRTWGSLYQQRPAPLEGDLFKVGQFRIVDSIPHGTRFFRAWDLGGTEGGGDWTVGTLIGTMPDKRTLVGDVVRGQWDAAKVEEKIIDTAHLDGRNVPIFLPQDPGQAGKAQIAYLVKQLKGYKVFFNVMTGDKETRATPLASQVNAGNVCLLRAGWNYNFIEELRSFPTGRHDDQVDSSSSGFDMLVQNPGADIRLWSELGK